MIKWCISYHNHVLKNFNGWEKGSWWNVKWKRKIQNCNLFLFVCMCTYIWASQVVLVIKNPPANAGDIRDAGSIPGSGRSPGEGHGIPLQYSCLENPMDRGAWQAMVHRVAKSRIQLKWFSMHTCTSPNTYWVICQIWNFFTIQLYVLWCTVCLLHHWILPFFMELWEDLYFLPEM